jgi:solute carrier family 25 protein 38
MGPGITAGMAVTCITQPFGTLNTRMQLNRMIYKNPIQPTKEAYMEEGLMGFFDEISFKLIRKPLNSAIS